MDSTQTNPDFARRLLVLLVLSAFAATSLTAQRRRKMPESSDEPTLYFEDFQPRSMLVVEENPLTRSKFPFIDVHGHLFRAPGMSSDQIAEHVAEMDKMNMGTFVNLSGGSGENLERSIENTRGAHAGRFAVFANVDFSGIGKPGWGEKAARQLEADIRAGAQGLKIYKNLSMYQYDTDGNRVAADDPRIDPVWEVCARMNVPVLIHVGEPPAFWLEHDGNNERWLELKQFPDRKRSDTERFASFEQTMAEQHNLFRNHPNTKFINAHLGWYGNDLARLGELLDELPNMYTEIGAVLAELGRQPRTAREFLIRYQDRVLFGKDSWNPPEYHVYFRVLETADEYFDYYRARHAHWKMYGLDLPDEVLKKIYYKNALKLVPGIDASQYPE
ncbi:MAG: amidohydrolase family protein [Acidobacteriota bacterium]